MGHPIIRELRGIFDLNADMASLDDIRDTMVGGATVRGSNAYILICAILIAAVGLNMNSTAVIIGAMLISPLMGGIIAMGYGIATLDIPFFGTALKRLFIQVVISVAVASIYFAVSPIETVTNELFARTEPTFWDALIAVFGGFAGAIGLTRKEKSNVISGVAIATALMPPLCTVGYGIGTGQLHYSMGALYLFLINMFCIFLTTVIVLKLIGVPTISEGVGDGAKTQQRVRRVLAVALVVILIPSLAAAAGLAKTTARDANITAYLDQEFDLEYTSVVDHDYDDGAKRLEVRLVGQWLPSEKRQALIDAAERYDLKDVAVDIKQEALFAESITDEQRAALEKELLEAFANGKIGTSGAL